MALGLDLDLKIAPPTDQPKDSEVQQQPWMVPTPAKASPANARLLVPSFIVYRKRRKLATQDVPSFIVYQKRRKPASQDKPLQPEGEAPFSASPCNTTTCPPPPPRPTPKENVAACSPENEGVTPPLDPETPDKGETVQGRDEGEKQAESKKKRRLKKPKRKIFQPKILVEKKVVTPKPKTPKPTIKKDGLNGNRTYVRRKKAAPRTDPSCSGAQGGETKSKSAKRRLEFDLDSQGANGLHRSTASCRKTSIRQTLNLLATVKNLVNECHGTNIKRLRKKRLGRENGQYKSLWETPSLHAIIPYVPHTGDPIQSRAKDTSQNALIAYGAGMMVPYKNTVKKSHPWPKVALDKECYRQFDIAEGNISIHDNQGRDKDAEDRWKKDTRILLQYLSLFVHINANFLGDRRFSKWDGSIVDSVVGVYLTQNVTDYLSSNAFMSLAAKFPNKSRGNDIKANEGCLQAAYSYIHESEQEINLETTHTRTNIRKPEIGNSPIDWDDLRKQAFANGATKERSSKTMDSVDWEAVLKADVTEISEAIRTRGQHNVLAKKIKSFLERLMRDHGSIDLEWLRHVPPDKAKEYLKSIKGLGPKSVDCISLLSLHHVAFPVDVNVARILTRLGWVPLQQHPDLPKLHLLERYPQMQSVQIYLWPRISTLDQAALYELHYYMITFGKVFCTKSKPNCNACPLRRDCSHFASAVASANALPAPAEKSIVTSKNSIASRNNRNQLSHTPLLESRQCTRGNVCHSFEPIIEEPTTPEHESIDYVEEDMEDLFINEDPDEIPEDSDEILTLKLNSEEFTKDLQNFVQEKGVELQDGDISNALVALTSETASIPMPKLKNITRLRTEHLAYELHDSHPLLERMDRRELDDPSPYLLVIWTPGETGHSTIPPETCSNPPNSGGQFSQEAGCSYNSTQETQEQTVRGTLLIPCRTATRGRFPLNGTYFQVNEVFADHQTSYSPLDVPRKFIWNLRRRTIYFGTSVTAIARGLSQEAIRQCFHNGFVCVRGFDRENRSPKALSKRLHEAASKASMNKKTPNAKGQKEAN